MSETGARENDMVMELTPNISKTNLVKDTLVSKKMEFLKLVVVYFEFFRLCHCRHSSLGSKMAQDENDKKPSQTKYHMWGSQG